jgi:hypothetical protein
MVESAVLVLLWRSANVTMAAICLALLIADAVARRRLHLRARFYWEAVALLLFSIMWSTTELILHPPHGHQWSPARTAVVSVALVYFLVSVWRSRRLTSADEADLGR